MDEPFGALDINTRLQMQDLLCKIWTELQCTVIFVTHDIPEAVYLADEIHILRAHPGQIVSRIDVELPLARNRDLKRSPTFTRYVHQVEDEMINIQNFVEEEQAEKERKRKEALRKKKAKKAAKEAAKTAEPKSEAETPQKAE